jgi:dihydropteroate synthase
MGTASAAAHVSGGCAPATQPLRFMGVINVTPDSFSDGGRFLDPARAIERGLELEAEGADILDLGGESTRPGALSIDADEELSRVLPVVLGLAKRTRAWISIDTTKSVVARAALDAGAAIVNDVSAGRADSAMLPLVASRGATCVLMHMRGTPRDMQTGPVYTDVVGDVAAFLRERVHAAAAAGIQEDRVWIDPGIGFGKTVMHNLALLVRLHELRSLGLPICLGVSRKSFVAGIESAAGAPSSSPEARSGGTAAAVALGVLGGATILRVHDVAIMAQAARGAHAYLQVRNARS